MIMPEPILVILLNTTEGELIVSVLHITSSADKSPQLISSASMSSQVKSLFVPDDEFAKNKLESINIVDGVPGVIVI